MFDPWGGNDKLYFIKIVSLYFMKDTVKRMKNATDWGKYLQITF